MTSDYRLTPAAQAGYLRVVIDAEAQFDAALALRVELEIERAFEQLARMPRSGHLRPDLTHDVTMRFWSVGPTLIAYRTWQDAIEVVLVARAERDWGHMLEEQEEEA